MSKIDLEKIISEKLESWDQIGSIYMDDMHFYGIMELYDNPLDLEEKKINGKYRVKYLKALLDLFDDEDLIDFTFRKRDSEDHMLMIHNEKYYGLQACYVEDDDDE